MLRRSAVAKQRSRSGSLLGRQGSCGLPFQLPTLLVELRMCGRIRPLTQFLGGRGQRMQLQAGCLVIHSRIGRARLGGHTM